MKVGRGQGRDELQLICRTIGRWSENAVLRTEELKMGKSGVRRKRSRIEAEEEE